MTPHFHSESAVLKPHLLPETMHRRLLISLLLLLSGCTGPSQPVDHVYVMDRQASGGPRVDGGQFGRKVIDSNYYAPRPPGLPYRENRDNLDPDNPGKVLLQPPSEALSQLPTDRSGQVDWIASLYSGKITPRTTLENTAQPMEIRDTAILMKNTQGMPWVRFPHEPHTRWLACSNCHPAIFIAEEGANEITMSQIIQGEKCGRCHGKVAFSDMTCERCHSVPQPGMKKWW